MSWLVPFASLAVPVAVIVAVLARHYRTTDTNVPAQWGPAVLLGVLWPSSGWSCAIGYFNCDD